MADRRITVLNPDGYQEVLQASDRLFVESDSQLAQTDFAGNVTGTNAAFSGKVTVQGAPTADKDVVTLDYLVEQIDGINFTGIAPISVSGENISISAGTVSEVGAVRFASTAEVTNASSVFAAVTPDQLSIVLDDINITAGTNVSVTQTGYSWEISVPSGNSTTFGAVKYATNAEASTGTAELVAINPLQLKTAIDNIPYATSNVSGLIQIATGAEVTAGVSNTVAVTPAQLSQVVNTVDVTVNAPLTVSETNRVFDLDINYATDVSDGTVRFATSAEISAGISGTVCVSAKDLATEIGNIEIVDGTTAVKGLMRFATSAEAAAGTETDAAVSPGTMRYALNQPGYVLDGGTY